MVCELRWWTFIIHTHFDIVLGPIELGDDAAEPNVDTADVDFEPQIDDIKVEFHPKAGHPPKFFRFNDYLGPRHTPKNATVPNQEPWEPFRSRLDFEIAELMLESHLNTEQSMALLSLFRKVIASPDDFTLSSTRDLERIWTDARKSRATGVSIRRPGKKSTC